MPFDDPEMEQLALKAIRRLKSEFVKQEVYADTSPCGLADAVYADAESNEICAMEREGPINKCLLDDILHITKDRAGSEPCLSGVGAPGQRDTADPASYKRSRSRYNKAIRAFQRLPSPPS